MAHESDSSLNVPKAISTGRSYLAVLTIVIMVGVALSAFDGIARSVALPLILRDLHLSLPFGGLVLSGSFVVTFVVNLVLGQMMDSWGRKNTFLVSVVATAFISGFTAFITQAWQFAVLGALAGVSLAVLPSAQVLAGEEMPAHRRGLMTATLTGSYAVGALVVGLVGSAVLPSGNWRLLFLLGFATIIVAIVALVTIREPFRAQEVQRIKRGDLDVSTTVHKVDVEKVHWSGVKQIFAGDLRRQTVVLMIAGFLLNMSTGLILTLGVTYFTLYDHMAIGPSALAITVDSVASLVGGILLGWIGDSLPSRNILILASLVGGIAVMLLAISGNIVFVYLLMVLFGFFGQGAIGTWYRYVAESFPTRARGTGVMLTTGTFFLGLAFAPAVFGALMSSGQFAFTALLAGGASAIGALVLLGGDIIAPRKELEDIHY